MSAGKASVILADGPGGRAGGSRVLESRAMRISRRLAWVILLAAVLTAALLRQFNDRIPESAFLPWPMRSLLFFLLLILFLLFLRGWGQRQELPYAGAGLSQFNVLAMVPFLIALIGEKWFSITFYAPVLRLAAQAGMPDPVLEALGVLLAGLGAVAVAGALLPVFPRLRPLLKEFLSARALVVGIAGTFGALALMYAGIAAALLLLGQGDLFLLPRWFGSWAGIRFSGQALVALGEEIYYRGLLQSELIFLLPALGVRRPVVATALGITIIAAQFATEHAGIVVSPQQLGAFVYTLIIALFLGSLLVTIRSLYLCALTHFSVNLFALGGGLQFTDRAGQPIVEPGLYIAMYLILITLLVYFRYAPERRAIVRRSLGTLAPG